MMAYQIDGLQSVGKDEDDHGSWRWMIDDQMTRLGFIPAHRLIVYVLSGTLLYGMMIRRVMTWRTTNLTEEPRSRG